MERPAAADLVSPRPGEPTATVAARVRGARSRAAARGVGVNADLPASSLDVEAPVDEEARVLLERHLRTGRLSARGLHRVRRLARTLADLDGSGEVVGAPHVTEALFLRGSRALVLGEEVR